jgi:DNA-3-methyladenine glycosylase II
VRMNDLVPIETTMIEATTHLRACDPILARLIERLDAPRITTSTRYFASLVSAILGQQISVKAARSIRARLDGLVPIGEEMTPEMILALSPEQLRAVGLSRAKIIYVVDLAEKVRSGRLDLPAIALLPDESIIEALVQVKGIGRWTAEMYLIFCLARPDVLPVGDLGLRTAAMRAYGFPSLPDAAKLLDLAEPWRPHRTIATWYLWRSLESTPTT